MRASVIALFVAIAFTAMRGSDASRRCSGTKFSAVPFVDDNALM